MCYNYISYKTKDGVNGVIAFDVYLEFDQLFEEIANKNVDGLFFLIDDNMQVVASTLKGYLLKSIDVAFEESLVSFMKENISRNTEASELFQCIFRI